MRSGDSGRETEGKVTQRSSYERQGGLRVPSNQLYVPRNTPVTEKFLIGDTAVTGEFGDNLRFLTYSK